MPDSGRPSLTEQIDEDEAWLTQQEAGQLAAINKRHAVLARLPHEQQAALIGLSNVQ